MNVFLRGSSTLLSSSNCQNFYPLQVWSFDVHIAMVILATPLISGTALFNTRIYFPSYRLLLAHWNPRWWNRTDVISCRLFILSCGRWWHKWLRRFSLGFCFAAVRAPTQPPVLQWPSAMPASSTSFLRVSLPSSWTLGYATQPHSLSYSLLSTLLSPTLLPSSILSRDYRQDRFCKTLWTRTWLMCGLWWLPLPLRTQHSTEPCASGCGCVVDIPQPLTLASHLALCVPPLNALAYQGSSDAIPPTGSCCLQEGQITGSSFPPHLKCHDLSIFQLLTLLGKESWGTRVSDQFHIVLSEAEDILSAECHAIIQVSCL